MHTSQCTYGSSVLLFLLNVCSILVTGRGRPEWKTKKKNGKNTLAWVVSLSYSHMSESACWNIFHSFKFIVSYTTEDAISQSKGLNMHLLQQDGGERSSHLLLLLNLLLVSPSTFYRMEEVCCCVLTLLLHRVPFLSVEFTKSTRTFTLIQMMLVCFFCVHFVYDFCRSCYLSYLASAVNVQYVFVCACVRSSYHFHCVLCCTWIRPVASAHHIKCCCACVLICVHVIVCACCAPSAVSLSLYV